VDAGLVARSATCLAGVAGAVHLDRHVAHRCLEQTVLTEAVQMR
jgi:hypothetical protein